MNIPDPFPRTLFPFIFFLTLFSSHKLQAYDTVSPLQAGFSQKINLDKNWNAVFSADCPLVSGRIAFHVDDITQPAKPDTDSWSVVVSPAKQFQVRAGSITVSGLPAAAKKPFFSISSPFYQVSDVGDAPITDTGTSRDTENISMEMRGDTWHAASLVSFQDSNIDESWIFASSRFNPLTASDTVISVSFFTGMRHTFDARKDDWFLNDIRQNGNRLIMPGLECGFRKSFFSVTATGFLSHPQSRQDGSFFQAEFAIDADSLLFCGGFCRCDRQFMNFDGKPAEILARGYLAPTYFFHGKSRSDLSGEIALLAWNDMIRGKRFYHETSMAPGYGGGVRMHSATMAFRLQYLYKTDKAVLYATIQKKNRFYPALMLGADCSAEYRDAAVKLVPDTVKTSDYVSISTSFGKKTAAFAKLGYRGVCTPATHKTLHAALFETEITFPAGHFGWKVTISGTIPGDRSGTEVSMTLRTTYR